jgi:hypothetical protein
MRIELSDPIAGLVFAVPLVALLMIASRSPVVLRQRPSQEGERMISAHQVAQPCGPSRNGNYRFVARRWRERSRASIGYVRAEQRWHSRPEAMIDCEVFVSCQQMTVMSER